MFKSWGWMFTLTFEAKPELKDGGYRINLSLLQNKESMYGFQSVMFQDF